MFLPRFSGDDNPDSWIFWAELYFTYLGFSEKDRLPLPYYYFDDEALAWFTWLHRNKQFFDWMHFKEKLRIRFRPRTFTDSVSREDTSRARVDYVSYAALVPQATSVSPVATLSHVPNSSDLEAAFNGGNSEAADVFDKLSNGADERDSHELPYSVLSTKIQVASDSVELEPIEYADSIAKALADDEDKVCDKNSQGTNSVPLYQSAHVVSLPICYDYSLFLPSSFEKPNAQVVFPQNSSDLDDEKISYVNKVFDESPTKDTSELISHVSHKESWLIPFLASYEYIHQHDTKFMIVNELSVTVKSVSDETLFVESENPAWDEEFVLVIKQPLQRYSQLVGLSCIILHGCATLPSNTKKTILNTVKKNDVMVVEASVHYYEIVTDVYGSTPADTGELVMFTPIYIHSNARWALFSSCACRKVGFFIPALIFNLHPLPPAHFLDFPFHPGSRLHPSYWSNDAKTVGLSVIFNNTKLELLVNIAFYLVLFAIVGKGSVCCTTCIGVTKKALQAFKCMLATGSNAFQIQISTWCKLFKEQRKHNRIDRVTQVTPWPKNAFCLHICKWFDIGQMHRGSFMYLATTELSRAISEALYKNLLVEETEVFVSAIAQYNISTVQFLLCSNMSISEQRPTKDKGARGNAGCTLSDMNARDLGMVLFIL